MVKRKRKKRPAHNRRPMSGKSLNNWRFEMGLSQRDAAERLGMSYVGFRNAENNGAPLYIALACAALLKDLAPYENNKD